MSHTRDKALSVARVRAIASFNFEESSMKHLTFHVTGLANGSREFTNAKFDLDCG